MCDDEIVDNWTWCHLLVSACLGAAVKWLRWRRVWAAGAALLVGWELVELTGRRLGWTWVRAWFECESWGNVISDLVVGAAGYAADVWAHGRWKLRPGRRPTRPDETARILCAP